jgi:hypothetical protein
MTSRRHAPDEHAGVAGVRLHPDAIAENRPTRERTRRIDGNHANGAIRRTNLCGQLVDERALTGARRTGDADNVGAAGTGIEAPDEIGAERRFVLDERDGARDRAGIAREHAIGQRRVGHWLRSCLAITSRWISLVPSPIVSSLTSRKYFSAG